MTRYTLVHRDEEPQPKRTRKTIELTAAQNGALQQMISHAEQTASAATGLDVSISSRQFFHMLLKKHAEQIGVAWPEDYPQHGGKR